MNHEMMPGDQDMVRLQARANEGDIRQSRMELIGKWLLGPFIPNIKFHIDSHVKPGVLAAIQAQKFLQVHICRPQKVKTGRLPTT
jgi:hypothetical protein